MYDTSEIRVKAGNGGDGAISFRREKSAPQGGPDGGDGGAGGDVLLQADQSVASLRLFKRNRLYRAGDGSSGKGRKKKGKKGVDLVLKVPVGTIVWEREPSIERHEAGEANGVPTREGGSSTVADLAEHGQEAVIARGGRGGAGNVHFASSTNQVPRIAQKGEDGEDKLLFLELRLIADVGIIGLPNVGKSSLLAAASRAKPKIAAYPFTTLEPVPGVVDTDGTSFVLAEIPGLIEGAHAGRGLGSEFLRHALRTKMLVHLLDGSGKSPLEDMIGVNTELRLFDGGLAAKPQLVAVNKIDMPEVRERIDELRATFSEAGSPAWFVSAATGEGVPALMAEAARMLKLQAPAGFAVTEGPRKVFRPLPRDRFELSRDGEAFVVSSPDFERIVARVDMNDPEVLRQIRGFLDRTGIGRRLVKMGINRGDKVRSGGREWEW
jgi:GTP-binding protein